MDSRLYFGKDRGLKQKEKDLSRNTFELEQTAR
jgi:hypothetical protein